LDRRKGGRWPKRQIEENDEEKVGRGGSIVDDKMRGGREERFCMLAVRARQEGRAEKRGDDHQNDPRASDGNTHKRETDEREQEKENQMLQQSNCQKHNTTNKKPRFSSPFLSPCFD